MNFKSSPVLSQLPVFVAGLLLPLAFAPVQWSPLAVIVMAYLLYRWRDASASEAWWTGWVFGTAMFISGVYWVFISMHDFGAVPVVFAALLSFLFALFLGLFPAFAGWLSARYFKAHTATRLMLLLPTLWVLLEWVRSWFFTGFPWLNLGVSQVTSPLAGYAPVLGEYAMSWLLMLSAGACVYLLQANKRQRLMSVALLLVVWSTGYGLQHVAWTESTGKPFRVSLVQGNVDQNKKWDPEFRVEIISSYLELTRGHWDSDVIIWPETAVSAFYHHVPEVVSTLESLARDSNTDMLVGIPQRDLDTKQYYNSILRLGEGGRAFYQKRHLVPFGEFIPLSDWLSDVLDFMGLPMSGFSRGAAGQAPLRAGGYLAGLTICYEIVFNSEVIQSLPQAHYLVNVSNNTWFGDSSMPHQQLQMSQLRALETERYVLSATNNGVSAVVDNLGRVVGRSPQFQAHVLDAYVQARSGATPYVKYGNYPLIIILLLIVSSLLVRSKKNSA